jgi:hypothetical protein
MISSNIDDLTSLHRNFGWIPNENTIRPSPENIQRKRDRMEMVVSSWTSFDDYILHTIFGKPLKAAIVGDDKYAVSDRNVSGMILFLPNEFPYNLEEGFHWVLWYGTAAQPCSDEEITEDVRRELLSLLGDSPPPFDFAW